MKRKSLRSQIYIVISVAFTVVVVVSAALLYPFEKKRLDRLISKVELSISAMVQQKNNDLANEMFLNHQKAIEIIIRGMKGIDESIMAVSIYKSDGSLMLSTDVLGDNKVSQEETKLIAGAYLFRKTIHGGKHVLTFSKPIIVIGEHLGYVKVYYNLQDTLREVRTEIIIFAMLFLGFVLSVAVLLGILLSKYVTKPISILMTAMKKIQDGDLGVQVKLDSKNEIGEMANAFNKMSKENASMYEELDSINKELEDMIEKRTVELIQARNLESIGTLAAGIAHEMNTPIQFVTDNVNFLSDTFKELLKFIGLYRSLLLNCNPGEKTKEAIDTGFEFEREMDLPYIESEVPDAFLQTIEGLERVAKIADAMKDFSYIGSEEKKMSDINKAIESTIMVAGNTWKYVATMEAKYDVDLPKIMCLLHDINQAIMNLIINAAYAITQVVGDGIAGKGKIMVKTSKNTEDTILISVSDTGTGIPKKIRDKIFDPFFTTKEIGKGTGQGLSIAYSAVVEKHGGKLTFETEEGKGTTFYIELPIEGKRKQSDSKQLV